MPAPDLTGLPPPPKSMSRPNIRLGDRAFDLRFQPLKRESTSEPTFLEAALLSRYPTSGDEPTPQVGAPWQTKPAHPLPSQFVHGYETPLEHADAPWDYIGPGEAAILAKAGAGLLATAGAAKLLKAAPLLAGVIKRIDKDILDMSLESRLARSLKTGHTTDAIHGTNGEWWMEHDAQFLPEKRGELTRGFLLPFFRGGLTNLSRLGTITISVNNYPGDTKCKP